MCCKSLILYCVSWSQVVITTVNIIGNYSICLLIKSLYSLMEPLKALEAYQLAIGLSCDLADTHGCASSLCQSASLLLDMGASELALVLRFCNDYFFSNSVYLTYQ